MQESTNKNEGHEKKGQTRAMPFAILQASPTTTSSHNKRRENHHTLQ